MPRADQQQVAHDDPAAARAPARLEDHRAGDVATRGRDLDAVRAEPERAAVAIEDRAEDARRVEAGEAQPLDGAARRDERARLAVRQECVIGNRRELAPDPAGVEHGYSSSA